MADTDRVLKILLQLQSDVTGATQTKAAIKDLQDSTGTVTDQLKAAGAQFDPLTRSFKSIADESKNVGSIWEQSGVSLARARNEAVTLVRELAAGAPVSRTIGALVGSLGIEIGLAGIAAFSVIRAIDGWATGIATAAVEQEKFTESINKSVEAAIQLAKLSTSFADIVRVEQTLVAPIDQLILKLREAQIPVMGLKGVFEDMSKSFFSVLTLGATQGPFDFSGDKKKQVEDYSAQLKTLRSDFLGATAAAEKTKESIDQIKDAPAGQAFNLIGKNISDLSREADRLKQSLKDATDPTTFEKTAQAIIDNRQQMAVYQGLLDTITSAEQKATDQATKWSEQIHQIDLSKLDPQEKVKALQTDLENANKKLADMGYDSVAAAIGVYALKAAADNTAPDVKDLANAIAAVINAERALVGAEKAADRGGRAAETRDWTAALREAETVIQGIRQLQQLIEQNPFLLADQKALQSLQTYQQEMIAVQHEIDQIQAKLSSGALNVDQSAQAHQKLQTLNFDLDQMKLKIEALQQPLRTELISWVNSFGTAAHQASQALTGTLSTAIGGISQGLTGLIFGSKNWAQAFVSAAQSIVQSLIQIALQFVVSRLLMSALNKASAATDAGAAGASAAPVAAAWAPAATSASIATFGAASGAGLAAYLAALAAGTAGATALASVGGFAGAEEGGFFPGVEGRPRGIFHGGEFIFSAPAVRNIGAENLDIAHKSALGISSQSGSASGGGGGRSRGAVANVQVINLIDRSKLRRLLSDGFNGQRIVVDPITGKVIQVS